ncbi:acetate--CoA ligase family protein [Nocardioides panzhihuensis]|uniref:Acyl-CoA synthetase (NDP forming) n=1 Tax=Nocardioides panzhihuensis TaxID=860243 RepID=A0A7Z0DNC2_9ACTN|nr:acyl-CoA synthetase (NDP forming) [Nocardioides panzhihuensis]
MLSPIDRTRPGALRAFRDPRSVAVVGASDNPAKWGYWIAQGALRGAHRRDVWLVNRSADQVQGHPAHPSMSALPKTPELVVLCVPAAHVDAVVEDALERGVRAFLAITSGVTDCSRIRERLASAGARLVGPNSLGLFDADTDLQLAWGHFEAGEIGIVSQSGQLGSEIANLAARAGLGVSRFVSVGNQLDVRAKEVLEDLIDHDSTKIVALYLESFDGGRDLVRTVRRLREAGKHTLVLATGASEGSKRLAASHTGSMTSAIDVVDAACRAAGAVRVRTPTELVEVARFLSVAELPAGARVAVVSDSGGQGGVAADVAGGLGLDTPAFSPQLQRVLADLLPAGASVANPIDLAGAGEADLMTYAVICERLAASGEVDAVLLSGYLGCYGEDTPALAGQELAVVDRLALLARNTHVPLVVHTMSAASAALTRMWEHGIPTFPAVESALRALARARHLSAHPGRDLERPVFRSLEVRPGYWAARDLLDRMGVPVPPGARVNTIGEARAAAEVLRAPFVLKAGWLTHKSEHDGVVLGLRSADELADAFARMHRRLGDGEYVVEEQDERSDVVELLVGARRDRDFGPLVTVGSGGTEAELWRDVRTEIAPVDRETAGAMVDALHSRPLLAGWRGRPGVDVPALVDVIVAASAAVTADPVLAELEINPVRVSPAGALAVDALAITDDGETDR